MTGMLKRRMASLSRVTAFTPVVGLRSALRVQWDFRERARGKVRPAGAPLVKLSLKGVPHPFYFRRASSDSFVIEEVFVTGAYESAAAEPNVRFVVDCGANIGCTAVYFLNKYPDAHVVAVEPDPENFALCRKNLEPYGDRVTLINAGVWSEETGLKIERVGEANQGEWSYEVRPCRAGEAADTHAVSLGSVLRKSPSGEIDVLKVDIEKSERVVFGEHTDSWLPKVRYVIIELHDDECIRAFEDASARHGLRVERADSLWAARRGPAESRAPHETP